MHFDYWVIIGFVGQTLFFFRYIWQWIASEAAKRSIIPDAFWYFSLAGGSVLLIYAIQRRDPVFILGQGTGLFIYARNIYLIWRERRRTA